MNESSLQNFYSVNVRPINFFSLKVACQKIQKKNILSILDDRYLLPKTSPLSAEKSFAEVKIGWCEEGIAADVSVHQKIEQIVFPEVTFGDSIELFIDTRDRKTTGWNTRFCHHFAFIAKEFNGLTGWELTRFRTEDAHSLCSPNELMTKSQISKNGYQIKIFIPAHCLHGFDPVEFDRMGFTYRINRFVEPPQHFQPVSEEFSIEQTPSLWSSLRFVS